MANPTPEELVARAVEQSWRVSDDLAWETTVDPEQIDLLESACLVRELDAYRKLSCGRRRAVRLREMICALSNLIFGEQRGAILAGQVVVDSAQARPDLTQFLGVMVTEEARHFVALRRYLTDKLGVLYPAHPKMEALFADLQRHPSWPLKLIVGQVLFEMTACSMLHSLFMRAKEPLLADMIRKILRDEARHAAFSYEVTGAVLAGQSRAARLEMEDMLFESVVACISGFLPIAAWREEGFSIPECRQAAVRALAEARVFDFYGRVFPQCLERYGLATDRLRALVAEDLPRRVEGDAIA